MRMIVQMEGIAMTNGGVFVCRRSDLLVLSCLVLSSSFSFGSPWEIM